MGPYPGGKKLQLHPTNLTHSTPVMWWKGLWVKGWRRVVGCVGLFVGFRDLLSADEQGKKKNDIFHAAVG
jgi:hypothetical protein